MSKLLDFLRNKSGQISIIMGLSLVPLMGAIGLSIDYLLLAKEKTSLQNDADRFALEQLHGKWISSTDYKVELSKQIDTYFITIFGTDQATINVKATATIINSVYRYEPPAFSSLEGTANDYNIIGFYCYNRSANTRTQYTPMSDNRGGSSPPSSTACEPGETIEYYMWNNRRGENSSQHKQNQECTFERFQSKQCRTNVYLTDSGAKNMQRSGIADYVGERDMYVETVLCDTLAECVKPNCTQTISQCLNYKKDGGKIPNKQSFRKPEKATGECAPGKYMYYGMEDRIASNGDYVDHDFDDAILIVPCPTMTLVSGRRVFLVE